MREHSNTVLIVDDEPYVRDVIMDFLTSHAFECAEASNAHEALQILHDDPTIGIVLTDLSMPGMTGLDLIASAKSLPDRELQFAILTGYGERQDVVQALRFGVKDFLDKPLDFDRLLNTVRKMDESAFMSRHDEQKARNLADEVATQKAEIESLAQEVHHTYEDSLSALMVPGDFHDPEPGMHALRIGAYCEALAKALDWPPSLIKAIRIAAPLHDIGMCDVPAAIAEKAAPLTDAEWDTVRTHPKRGHEILNASAHPIAEMAADIARAHHERWDGSGYPDGLSGEDIPDAARLVALADTYDALCSDRPYRRARSHADAYRAITQGDERTKPAHFSPDVLAAFETVSSEFEQISEALHDLQDQPHRQGASGAGHERRDLG